MLKYSKHTIIPTVLKKIFETIINFGIMPSNINVSLITPIPKKGLSSDKPENYRSILATAYSIILEHIIYRNTANVGWQPIRLSTRDINLTIILCHQWNTDVLQERWYQLYNSKPRRSESAWSCLERWSILQAHLQNTVSIQASAV